jgi:hypothetical protein
MLLMRHLGGRACGPDEREKLRDQRRELEKKLDQVERELREMRRGR